MPSSPQGWVYGVSASGCPRCRLTATCQLHVLTQVPCQIPWLPQGLAAATVPGIFSADGMADSGLALFESLSYRTFSVGENGFTWAGSRFDRPAPEHRELRLLLQVFVVG